MSHKETVIEPGEGITALVGPNNCGKSAVLVGLEAVCHRLQGDFMVAHGAKEASVTVETDDGHVVAWKGLRKMAEGEGFEPPERLLAQCFSRAPRSTTPAPFLWGAHLGQIQ